MSTFNHNIAAQCATSYIVCNVPSITVEARNSEQKKRQDLRLVTQLLSDLEHQYAVAYSVRRCLIWFERIDIFKKVDTWPVKILCTVERTDAMNTYFPLGHFVISKLKVSLTTFRNRCVHSLHFRHEHGSENWNDFIWKRRSSPYQSCSLPLYHGHFDHNSSFRHPKACLWGWDIGFCQFKIWVILYLYHCGVLCNITSLSNLGITAPDGMYSVKQSLIIPSTYRSTSVYTENKLVCWGYYFPDYALIHLQYLHFTATNRRVLSWLN